MSDKTMLRISCVAWIFFNVWWVTLPGLMHWQGAATLFFAGLTGLFWSRS